MPKKLTYELVKEQFVREAYQLLTKEYINNEQKLEYICPEGHKYSISWVSWRQGCRCAVCSGNAKLNISFIKTSLEKEGYILLSTEYKNSKSKLEYICPNGHKHSITWNEWQSGNRCFYCNGKHKHTIGYVRSVFLKKGFILISNRYINSHSKLKYLCPIGHSHTITFSNFTNGHGCPFCKTLNQTGPNSSSWKGGIACEPYCPIWLDKEFKQMILKRDNYQCQNPDCWGTGSKLTGHHIDYNKKNCDLSNLITLCRSCNSRANSNREYWIKFYQEIMNKKYGYKYG